MTKRNISFSPPDITEKEIKEVIDTLESGWVTTGPKTKLFEQKIAEYLKVNRTACLSSATAAMELTLRILNIGPGDEVITTPYTYSATAAVVKHVGAKLIMVDLKEDSFEMDYEKLNDLITENTKAIMPVDIAGKMCDYNKIYEIVKNNKNKFKSKNYLQEKFNRIIVLADCAHAFGAERDNLNAGQVADFSCFSFHAVKNLTTAEGGAVAWKNIPGIEDDELYNKYMLHSLHGQSKDALSKTKRGSWEYDIVLPGHKYNMTDILASIGLMQLERYDYLLERRKKIIDYYNQKFKSEGIKVLDHFGDNHRSSGHLYLTRIPGITEKERNKIIELMSKKGISTNVHYKPLPMFTAYKNLGFHIDDYPNAYNTYKNEITLPLHTLLEDEDLEYITKSYINIVKKYI